MRLSLILVGILAIAGCNEHSAKVEKPAGGVKVEAPGVSVDAGNGGAKVSAPGVNVDAGGGGAKVDAPGVKVDTK